MKFDSKKVLPSDSQGAITADNYLDRATAYIRAHDGEGFVIVVPGALAKCGRQTPASWRAWISYLSDLGVKTNYIRKICWGSVPCEWPEDFDATAPDSDRLWEPFPEQEFSDDHCAAMRRRIVGLFRELSASLDRPDPNDRRRRPLPDARGVADPAQHAAIARANLDHANRLKDRYSSEPVVVSDELWHKLNPGETRPPK